MNKLYSYREGPDGKYFVDAGKIAFVPSETVAQAATKGDAECFVRHMNAMLGAIDFREEAERRVLTCWQVTHEDLGRMQTIVEEFDECKGASQSLADWLTYRAGEKAITLLRELINRPILS
jgi:hypothetical protein